jgi:putative ABC transport system permease protein
MVIMLSVMFGIWAGLFIQSYLNGAVEERVRIAITKEISHLQLHHPEFKKEYDAKYIIENGSGLVAEIGRMAPVRAVTGRVIAKGMVATATGSAGITVNGIDPASEDSVTHIRDNVIEGSYFSAGAKHEILVGEKLLKKLKLKLNSKVVLTLLDKDNNLTAGAFRIKGVYKTPNTPYDEANAFVTGPELAALLNTRGGIHEIAVLLHTNDSLASVAGRIRTDHPSLLTETWTEVSPELDLVVSTMGQSLWIYMSIIMLALAFGIINTMMMARLERTREIGMLMALGMSKLRLFAMILTETVFLVFIGTPAGMLGGFFTAAYLGKRGIDMSSYKEVYESFGFGQTIFPRLNPEDYYAVVQMVILTAVISSLFPARKALSLNPSEAIRR